MKSLAARLFLILLVTTVIIQVLSFGGVLAFSGKSVRAQMYEFMATDLRFAQRFLAELAPSDRESWLDDLGRGYYSLALVDPSADLPLSDHPWIVEVAHPVQQALGDKVSVLPLIFDEPPEHLPALSISLDQTHSVLVYLPQRPPFAPPPLGVIVAYLGFVTLAVMIAAWVAVRLAIRPLKRLGDAARSLTHNLDSPPLPVKGADEVARASEAFNRMQSALRHHLSERTRILAAISHDLKTPLTRLRLRVGSLLGEQHPERSRIDADLDDMELLIQEGMDFARSQHVEEALVPTDLQALVESVVEQYEDMGQSVVLTGLVRSPVQCAPRALRRAVQNLVDNALKYGVNVTIRLHQDDAGTQIQVEDKGSGIPEELLDKVFEPFFRIEGSRNRDSGGTGLGLAITRNLTRAQGGEVWLENDPDGGLVAVLKLPR